MESIKESFQWLASSFSKESKDSRKKVKDNTKSQFQCLKFIMKKFKIYLPVPIKDQLMDLKLDKTKLWEFMLKGLPSILFCRMLKLKRKCKRDQKTDL